MRVSVFMISAVAALSGCADGAPALDASSDGSSTSTACAGPRPTSVDQCERGLYFADCGGTGGPVLGCAEATGRCAWYRTACVPSGVRPIDCPPDDVCCRSTPDGLWPYEGAWRPEQDMATVDMVSDIAAMGWAVVDETTPSEIAVTVDPTVAAPASNEADCTPGTALDLCGDGPLMRPAIGRHGLSMVVLFRSLRVLSDWVYLEVIPSAPSHRARVFIRPSTDFANDVPTRCMPFEMGSVSGTLRLDTADLSSTTDVHGILEMNVAGGGAATLAF